MRYIKLFILLVCFQLLKSQSFFIETNNGYGIPFMKVLLGYQLDTSNRTTLNYGTYGGGFNFNLGGGYMFNDYIGVGLIFNYVHGKNTLTNDIRMGFIPQYRTDYARMYLAIPMLIVKTPSEKINFLGRIGAIIPMGGYQITEAYLGLSNPQIVHIDSAANYLKIKTFGKFNVGGLLGLGIEYNITEKLAISAEVQSLFLHIKSKKAKLIEYKEKGVDKYDEWDDLGKSYETIFVDTYQQLKPNEDASTISSYSALRFNLGFKFYLTK